MTDYEKWLRSEMRVAAELLRQGRSGDAAWRLRYALLQRVGRSYPLRNMKASPMRTKGQTSDEG